MEIKVTKKYLSLAEIPKSVFLLVPINVFGLWAIYSVFAGTAPTWWWIATILGFVLQKEIGVSAGYHRLFSHYAFKVSRPIKLFILWCGMISAQGSPFWWAAVHRGYHHRFTDTEKDPHSPIHGFWHSYCLWLFSIKEKDLSIRSIVDLMKDKDLIFAHRYYHQILALSHIIVAFISIELWFFFMALPAFLTFHSYCIQTSLQHVAYIGYRNFDTKDNSTNNLALFPLVFGDAWHNNHHNDPGNPNFGSRRWWEIDTTYFLIKLLRKND